MAKYEVYRNPNPRSRGDAPYLLDVQAEVFRTMSSRVVVPLYREAVIPKPMRVLQPSLTVEGATVVMDTLAIVGLPVRSLGERVGDLSSDSATILAALDLMLTGA